MAKKPAAVSDRYKWVALANTTAAMFMATLDGSIVIIALPAIFRGIHLDPLAPGNISYLLWMIMGYRLVQAVLVVTLGRLGDMFGRVRIYNAGFVVFTLASILLSFDPFARRPRRAVADRLAGAAGGRRLDADGQLGRDPDRRVPGRAARLRARHQPGRRPRRPVHRPGRRAACWPPWTGARCSGSTCRSASSARSGPTCKLRDNGERHRGRIDWWGNVTFAVGLGAILIAITYGIQPYGGHTMGWTNPVVHRPAGRRRRCCWSCSCVIETQDRRADVPAQPVPDPGLHRRQRRPASPVSIARGGLQFMLIIWLQGIWLPLHGYNYSDTPLWAGIFLLPLTAGFLVAGPISGLPVRPVRRPRLRHRRHGSCSAAASSA